MMRVVAEVRCPSIYFAIDKHSVKFMFVISHCIKGGSVKCTMHAMPRLRVDESRRGSSGGGIIQASRDSQAENISSINETLYARHYPWYLYNHWPYPAIQNLAPVAQSPRNQKSDSRHLKCICMTQVARSATSTLFRAPSHSTISPGKPIPQRHTSEQCDRPRPGRARLLSPST